MTASQRTDSQRALRQPVAIPRRATSIPQVILALKTDCCLKEIRGSLNAFQTPFLRAYASSLTAFGISKADFIAFIDGFNEAFLGNPILQGTNLAGMVLSQCYGLHTVQLAGGIVQLVSGFGSAAVSYGRTRMYVKAMNENLFNPAGLHVNVLSTEKMLKHVGFPEETFPPRAPSEDEAATSPNSGDSSAQPECEPLRPDRATLRRMQALEGYCQPLDYDVSATVKPDNLLRRMGNAQADRLTRKHEKKTRKDYDKADKEDTKKEKDVSKKRREVDRKIEKLERKLAKEGEKLERKLASSKVQSDPKEQKKVQEDFEKEVRHIEKDIEKEMKEVAKESRKCGKDGRKERAKVEKKEGRSSKRLRWIVVSLREEGEAESEDSLEVDDESVENETHAASKG